MPTNNIIGIRRFSKKPVDQVLATEQELVPVVANEATNAMLDNFKSGGGLVS